MNVTSGMNSERDGRNSFLPVIKGLSSIVPEDVRFHMKMEGSVLALRGSFSALTTHLHVLIRMAMILIDKCLSTRKFSFAIASKCRAICKYKP